MFSDSIPSLEDIDTRLSSLRLEISTLCNVRNTHYSATSKLPPETLASIFEYVSQARVSDDDDEPVTLLKSWSPLEEAKGHYAWVKEVTHICRTWRSIALASPRLWASALITTATTEWAANVLCRAQRIPLDISFPISFQNADNRAAGVKMVESTLKLAHLERIRSIRVRSGGEPDRALRALHSSMTGADFSPLPMPLLNQFTVITSSTCHIPDTLFGTTVFVPRLQDLRLHNCAVNLNTPRFHGLNTLHLSSFLHDPALSLHSLYAALKLMSNLEVLILDDIFSDQTTSVAS